MLYTALARCTYIIYAWSIQTSKSFSIYPSERESFRQLLDIVLCLAPCKTDESAGIRLIYVIRRARQSTALLYVWWPFRNYNNMNTLLNNYYWSVRRKAFYRITQLDEVSNTEELWRDGSGFAGMLRAGERRENL